MEQEQRLIDVSKARKEVAKMSSHVLCEWDTMGVLMMLDRQKIVDAVPVVRCGECRHNGTAGCTHAYIVRGDEIRFASPYMTDSDFCSRGEPRTPPAE